MIASNAVEVDVISEHPTVPLVRPSMPDVEAWGPLWRESTTKSGQYSNFGPLWFKAAGKLSEMTGMIALPCSTGTDAVALAIHASQMHVGQRQIEIEAFTFEATLIAADRMFLANTVVVPTGAEVTEGKMAVRTRPFGNGRKFEHRTGVDVIDCAGGFGPTNGFIQKGLNVPIAVSFHATKNFPIGEGGCVFLPRDWDYAARAVSEAMNFGFDSERRRNRPSLFATNAKLDELRCALLLAQLARASYFAERSARIRRQAMWLVANAPKISIPFDMGAWQSLLVVHHPDPDALCVRMMKDGLHARRVYWPNRASGIFSPVERGLVALPSDATDEEIKHIAAAIEDTEC